MLVGGKESCPSSICIIKGMFGTEVEKSEKRKNILLSSPIISHNPNIGEDWLGIVQVFTFIIFSEAVFNSNPFKEIGAKSPAFGINN
jgi:hypothetical protein